MRLVELLAVALVALIGFSAHRASLCTVKAVGEILTSGTLHMLSSFMRAALWATLVAGALMLARPGASFGGVETVPHGLALAGGFVFGVGAAINGGCSLSTLQRLVDGNLGMLAALAALVGGMLAWSAVEPRLMARTLQASPTLWLKGAAWGGVVVAGLALWGGWEVRRLLRTTPAGVSWRTRCASHTYRPATAAALMGAAAGTLYPLQGAWTYTNYLGAEAGAWLERAVVPSMFHGLLVLAMLGGMLASSMQRRSFRLQRPSAALLARSTAGGLLMGFGSGAIPGGNDSLLLAAIPGLSPWAFATYLSLLAGVAAAMLVMRSIAGPLPPVRCTADGCE